MKFFTKVMFLILVTGTAHAAKVEDVTILDLKQGKDTFELKLQLKDAPKDSYFVVDIIKKDEQAFDKLALVLMKMKKKKSFKLDLDIASFSPYPSGSYYRSDSVKFSGTAEGESLLIK